MAQLKTLNKSGIYMNSLDLIVRSWPLLIQGTWMTVQIALLAAFVSLCLGTCLGVLMCNRLRIRAVSSSIEFATFILRAVPFYVQLVIVYFVLPDLFQFSMEAYTASVLALGVCSSGYVAQVVRCGINSIPRDQWDAACTLGYSTTKTLRYVIAPQLVFNILPALCNELDALLKSTAILSSIGLLELTRVGMNIVSREMDPLTIYCTVAAFYVVISGVMNLLSKYIEKRCTYAFN